MSVDHGLLMYNNRCHSLSSSAAVSYGRHSACWLLRNFRANFATLTR